MLSINLSNAIPLQASRHPHASPVELDQVASCSKVSLHSCRRSPYSTFAARDRAQDAAARKATAYQADPSLRLFVESDDSQAREIGRRTGRPVFSVARNGLV